MSSPWGRVERMDAEWVAAQLAEEAGVRLIVEGPCSGGEVGAAFARWPDGRRSVLKWRPGTRLEDLLAGPIAVSEAMRAAGAPVPETQLAAQLGSAIATVQELLPGAPVAQLDSAGLDQALAFNELQAGLLADRHDIPPLELFLLEDGPGFCLHGPLRAHNRRTAHLDDWITAVGAEHPGPLRGDDAVHVDFHPGNLLAVDGTITGIIDWDGAGRGDRRLDLVTLRFGIPGNKPDRTVVARLDDALDGFPDDLLRPLWATMSLRMVDWAIRHFTPTAVDYWLDLAESRAD